MSNQFADYNIEDTAALMTGAKGKSHKLWLILALISFVLVLVIAFLGYRTFKENRYNEIIEIADKAFIEGDYEQAEAEYLAAIDIDRRKPKARESLAYTYAVQNKSDKSIGVYEELYKDTGEEKYLEAANDVSAGRLPLVPGLIPVAGTWRNIPLEQVAYYQVLQRYLSVLNDEYYFWDETNEFVSDNPGKFPALSILMAGYGSYEISVENELLLIEEGYEEYNKAIESERLGERIEGADPRGWTSHQDLYDYYEVYDVEKTNSMIKFLFNIGDEDIERIYEQAENHNQMYIEDGKYYCVSGWPTGTPGRTIEINDVWTDGSRFCIEYDFGYAQMIDGNAIDRSDDYITRYATLELKEKEGKHYWSVYYVGRDKPQEVATPNNDEIIEDGDKRDDSIFPSNLEEWYDPEHTAIEDYNEFESFITKYLNFSGPREYDSRDTGNSTIIQKLTGDPWFVNEIYPIQLMDNNNYTAPDPRGWQDEYWPDSILGGVEGTYYYLKTNVDAVQWIARKIFNCSDEDIKKMLRDGEDNKLLYREGDFYYYVAGQRTGVGLTPTIAVDSARRYNDYYYMEFSTDFDGISDNKKYYTLMQLKEIDGSRYWSLYYLSESPIEDFSGFVAR